MSVFTDQRTFTCECGFAGTMAAVQVHDCRIHEQGGRCEDYPCCGHTDGDGCQALPSHTAGYWTDLHDRMGDERYERYLEALDRQGF